MQKASHHTARVDDDFGPATIPAEEIETSESQPLRRISTEHSDADIANFVKTQLLEDSNYHDQKFKTAYLILQGTDLDEIPDLSSKEKFAIRREKSHKWDQPGVLYFIIFACSLGAIEQGWAQTGMNGANLYLPAEFELDPETAYGSFVLGLINCSLYLGQAFIGCWMSEPVNNVVGRKGAIFFGSLLCFVGNIGSSASWSWKVMVVFRLILGAGLGLNSSTVPVFAAECSPAYIRGGLAVSWQMFTAFGIFLGFLANVTFVLIYENSSTPIWSFQLAAPMLPAMLLLCFIFGMPESPAWYIKHDRWDRAYLSLMMLRHERIQAATELYSTYLSRRKNVDKSGLSKLSYIKKFRSLLSVSRNRHALYASYTVMLAQQLCGINIIAFYSSTIFLNSGFSPTQANWASVIFGLVNFLGAFPAIWTMDRYGRRWLMLWTLPPMAITMALAGLSFSLSAGTARLVILAFLIYIFCALYSPGVGPVPCAYSAEVYPLSVREVGMSFAISTASTWATVLSLTYPVLLEELGESASFELYAVLNLLAWVLCWAFVRETKGVELEDMGRVFESSVSSFIDGKWKESSWRWKGRRKGGKGWQQVAQDDQDM